MGSSGAPRAAADGPDPAQIAIRAVLLALGLVLAAWLAVLLRGVLVRLLLAVIVAAALTPAVDWLATRPPGRTGWTAWRPPRAAAVLLLFLALVATVLVLVALLVPLIAADTEDLIAGLPEYAVRLQRWVVILRERYTFLPPIEAAGAFFQSLLSDASQMLRIAGQAVAVVRIAFNVLGSGLDAILILVLALYFAGDGRRIRHYLIALLPPEHQQQAEQLAVRIGDRLGRWLIGQLALCAIIGGMSLAGLTLIGVRYAALLALIAGAAEALPTIGPIVSAIPAATIALFQSPQQGVLTLILYVAVQQLENNLIVPRVMSRAAAIHPAAVLVALMAGGELMGLAGALLAVPVAASLAVVIDEWRCGGQAARPERPSGSRTVREFPDAGGSPAGYAGEGGQAMWSTGDTTTRWAAPETLALPQLFDLTGKVAIITGGAAGIGFGIARRLAEAGASLVVADIDEPAAQRAAARLGAEQGAAHRVQPARVDVSVAADVQHLIDHTVSVFGGVDILVNNAGIFPMQPVLQMSEEQWDRVLDVNLKGAFLCAQAAARQMIRQGRGGVILNIASIDALHPSGVGLAHYDASKGGMLMFTKNLALELAPHAIRVLAIAPGAIATEGAAASTLRLKSAGVDVEQMMRGFLEKIPMRRQGVPDDIGRMALCLVSDLAAYMTGTMVVIDGGVLLA